MTRPLARYLAPLLGALLTLLGCKPAPPAQPATEAAPAERAESGARGAGRELEPPPPGEPPKAPFPTLQDRRLDNGLPLRVIERHLHPLIEVRLVVRSGTATDGDKPGLALLSGEMLKAGGAGRFSPRQLLEAAESLGTDLEIRTGRDATTIALNVTTTKLEAALEILSAVVLAPSFRPREFDLLQAREIERVKSAARGSAAWAASMVLYQELYSQPSGVHPYARYDALPGQLANVSLADCRAWYRAHFVPSNASLVIVGDVTADGVLALGAKWLGAWEGQPAPEPRFSLPLPAAERHVYLVDRPGSTQAQVYVALLGPERQSPDWPSLTVANQILGGGVSGRLFLDVREKRSLAYSTGASLVEVAVGPVPIVLSAGTQTPKAPDTVRALLQHLAALAGGAPSDAEIERAKAFLADSFLLELETVGSVAELTSDLEVLGLSEDYYDRYRAAVRALALPEVAKVAGSHYDDTPIIVVAGDASMLKTMLATFGPVEVLDPAQGFSSGAAR